MTPASDRQLVHIYMPSALRARMAAWEARTGDTHADLILTAIEETYQSPPLPPEPPSPAAPPPGKLFTRATRPASQSEALDTVGVRLLRTDVKLIDDLVSAGPTPSRSAYIVAALTAFLAQFNLEPQSQEAPDGEA